MRLGLSCTWSPGGRKAVGTKRLWVSGKLRYWRSVGFFFAIVFLLFIVCVCWPAWPEPGREWCCVRVVAVKSGCRCVCRRSLVHWTLPPHRVFTFLSIPPCVCRPSSANVTAGSVFFFSRRPPFTVRPCYLWFWPLPFCSQFAKLGSVPPFSVHIILNVFQLSLIPKNWFHFFFSFLRQCLENQVQENKLKKLVINPVPWFHFFLSFVKICLFFKHL